MASAAGTTVSGSEDIVIRQLKEEDIPAVVDWTTMEHWHVSDNIVKANYLADPNGFFAAHNHDGQLIGCIGSCKLSDDLAFGGFFIVKKEHRCKGVGRMLWDRRLQYLQDRNLAINAVAARIEPNKRRGFTYLTFDMEAYSGVPNQSKLTKLTLDEVEIIQQPQTQPEQLEELISYDTSVHLFQRKNFVKQWVNPNVTTCVAARKNGKIVGYGCVQPMKGGGHHLGPVLAEEGEIGEVLLNHLAKSIPDGHMLALDIPVTNTTSRQFVTDHAFECDLKLTRMMNKYSFDVPVDKVFATTTLGVSLL